MEILLDSCSAFFERCGFFFVPVFSLAALLNLTALKPGRVRYTFLLFSGLMLISYMVAGRGSSRYLLIPLLLWGCLAGAGSEMPWRYLGRFLPEKWFKPHLWLLVLTATVIICGVLKIALRDHSTVSGEFVKYLSNSGDKKFVLYAADCHQGVRLGSALRRDQRASFKEFKTFNEVVEQLAADLNTDLKQDIYIYTEIPRRYDAEDFRQWFRGKYYIFPFDIVHQARERSARFILLKFNGRIGDGVQTGLRNNVLTGMPETLPVKRFRSWAMADLSGYLPPEPDNAVIFVPDNGSMLKNSPIFRMNGGQLPAQVKLQLRNQLGWLEAQRSFKLSENTPPTAVAAAKISMPAVAVNTEPPLVAVPEKVFMPQDAPQLHLPGAIPLWHPEQKRIEIKISSPPSASGRFEFTVHDRIQSQSTSGSIELFLSDLQKLSTRKWQILMLEDGQSHHLQLSQKLQSLLHPQSSILKVVLPSSQHSSIVTAAETPLPPGDYDVILLNIFSDCFARSWSVPLNIGPFLDKYLTAAVKRLNRQFPGVPVALLLPPPPTAGDSMYPLSNSPLLSRIAHYNICSAAERWYQQQKTKYKNLHVVPLYLAVDQQVDYIRDSRREPVWSGNALTGQGKLKLAKSIGAFLVEMTSKVIQNKDKEQNHERNLDI